MELFFKKNLRGTTPMLLKIEHENMDEPLLLTDNNEDLVYEEKVYKSYFFKITMPTQSSESLGTAKLQIGCVDQQLIRIIRELTTPPTVTFVANYLKNGVYSKLEGYEMLFSNISWNASTMQGDLTLDILLNYDFPSGEFNPFNTPGVA